MGKRKYHAQTSFGEYMRMLNAKTSVAICCMAFIAVKCKNKCREFPAPSMPRHLAILLSFKHITHTEPQHAKSHL
jgi:hypothetical protein